MEKALAHIRSTGTFPVSDLVSPSLSLRHNHGAASTPDLFVAETKAKPDVAAVAAALAVASSSLPSSPSSPQVAAGSGQTTPEYPEILTITDAPLISGSLISIPPNDETLTNTTVAPLPLKQPTVESKEDQNSVGACPVTQAEIDAAKAKVQAWLQPGQPGHEILLTSPQTNGTDGPLKICLLDGFLLYSPTEMPAILRSIDIKLFLLVSRAKATHRREARDGYVTLEGFWKDPPGYVDKIVWPNYAESHAWLFEDGDAEKGVLDEKALEQYGILAQTGKGLDIPFAETLDWAVETVMRELERYHAGKKTENEGGEQ